MSKLTDPCFNCHQREAAFLTRRGRLCLQCRDEYFTRWILSQYGVRRRMSPKRDKSPRDRKRD